MIDFIFLGSKITADGNCSHEIKRCLLLGRKAMTNIDSVFKSRDITLPTKIHIVEAMVFPVVMYGCESWTIKKSEHQRINAFELLEKTLDVERAQTVTRSRDERGTCKAALPLAVALGAQYVPFLLLSYCCWIFY